MGRKIDETGNTYGRLKVKSESGRIGKSVAWLCKCLCGNVCKVSGDSLRKGCTQSCGCMSLDQARCNVQLAQQARLKHGLSKSREYKTWTGMKARCQNPNEPCYDNYGGRGIKVCERWQDFVNFYQDMGKRPNGTSIDRINNEGNYEPGNCRWATKSEQNKNQRRWLLS